MKLLSSGRTSQGDRWWTIAEGETVESCVSVVQRGDRACCSCGDLPCCHIGVPPGYRAAVTCSDLGIDAGYFFPLVAGLCRQHRACWIVQSPVQGRFARGRTHNAASHALLRALESSRVPIVGSTIEAFRSSISGPHFTSRMSQDGIELVALTADAAAIFSELPGVSPHGDVFTAVPSWPVAQAIRTHGAQRDGITAWLASYEERRKAGRAARGDYAGDFPIALLLHQCAAVAYAVKYRRMLLADDMGLGKTITALASIEACDAYPAIILVEPNAVFDFRDEAARLLPDRSVAIVRDGHQASTGADITLVTHDLLHHAKALRKVAWRALIIDEADHYADAGTKRYRAARSIATARSLTLRIAITGTPYRNQARDYLPLFELLRVTEEFGGRDYFLKRYCNGVRDNNVWRTGGVSNATELCRALYDVCLVRRNAAQAHVTIPPQNVAIQQVSLTNWSEYQRATDDLSAYLFGRLASAHEGGLGIDAIDAAIIRLNSTLRAPALVLRSAQRRISEEGKIEPAAAIIDDILRDPSAKVVVFGNFRSTVEHFARRFAGVAIHGGMDARSRHNAKTQFQKDPDTRVIACNLHAGKKNLTLTAATHALFVGFPWTFSDFEQARKRIARIGQLQPTTAIVLQDPRTCDRYDWAIVEAKRASAEATLCLMPDAA